MADEADADLLDPTPDIHGMFRHYNDVYFNGGLGACSVEWSSKRMTLCAGVCHYDRGGGCRIKLSEPLLKLRPTQDLKETLLHEMIHAALFLEGCRNDGPDGHGPKFQQRMHAINASRAVDYLRPPSGYRITIRHSLHDEVNNYRTHWWQCQRCGNTVKRAMNRPPQPADCRGRVGKGDQCQDERCPYHQHIRQCGGNYIKIKEPEKKQETRGRKRVAGDDGAGPSASAGAGGRGAKHPQRGGRDAVAATPSITSFFPVQNGAGGGSSCGPIAGRAQGGCPSQPAAGQPLLPGGVGQALGDLRTLCADAASRRQQQQQQQQPPPLLPPRGGGQVQLEDAPGEVTPPGDEDDVLDAVDLISSSDSEGSGGGAATGPQAGQRVHCPVCCMEWDVGAVSNEALNEHLDECLASMM